MQQGSGNVNVISHGGHIMALPEVGLPWKIDEELNGKQHRNDYKLKYQAESSPPISKNM